MRITIPRVNIQTRSASEFYDRTDLFVFILTFVTFLIIPLILKKK